MATGASGAVFFLGTRAHYQVLNPPESQFDVENGNASTETIYQNPSVQELFTRDKNPSATSVQELWPSEKKADIDNEHWEYNEKTITVTEEKEMESTTKRYRRRTSETTLCERDDMKPALLNSVLNPPESQFDVENGNASTETIYQNPSVQELFTRDKNPSATSVQELWPSEKKADIDNEHWEYNEKTITVTEEKEMESTTKRYRRRTSETTLCERDDMKPALLNSVGDSTPQKKCSKVPILTFLSSLTRRKRKLDIDEVQYLKHIDTALTSCTYRESCRCFDCQSRYFECDDSDEEYSSDDSYTPRYYQVIPEQVYQYHEEEEDDEVFVESVPGDNTSTDLLLDNTKMSVSSDETTELSQSEAEHKLQLEVAAGTPVLLNYLLTHPITCSIQ